MSTAAGAPVDAAAGARPRLPRWFGLAATTVVLTAVHFHRPEIFGRQLIGHDDSRYVAPLARMGLAEYFGSWLPAPDHYAFPLRDLTFWLDFRLGALVGLQLVWVTTLVYFALVLWALWGIASLVAERFGWSRLTVDLFVALVGLHPTFVEVVQWASMRKHLLPALFVALGTRHALRLYLADRPPRARDWAAFAGLHLASLLCYPSAALWLPWVAWLFRSHLRSRRWTAAAVLGFTGASLVATALWVVGNNTAFSSQAGALLSMRDLPAAGSRWLESVGRGFANWCLPVWIAPYYTPRSPMAWGGLVGAVGIAAWSASRLAKVPAATRRLAVDLFALAVALFIPSSYVLFNPQEYIWGDHYAYLPAPYFILALGLLAPARWGRAVLGSRVGRGLVLAGLALLAIRSAMAAEPWHSDVALFAHCADTEGAPRCMALAIQKEFDSGHCAAAERHLLRGRTTYGSQAGLDALFESEVPFYDALCVAMRVDLTLGQAMAELEALRALYRDPHSLIFARVLAPLYRRDLEAARRVADVTYLDPAFEIRQVSGRVIDYFRGQAEALCALADGAAQSECRARQAALQQRTAGVPVTRDYFEWGRLLSLALFGSVPPPRGR